MPWCRQDCEGGLGVPLSCPAHSRYFPVELHPHWQEVAPRRGRDAQSIGHVTYGLLSAPFQAQHHLGSCTEEHGYIFASHELLADGPCPLPPVRSHTGPRAATTASHPRFRVLVAFSPVQPSRDVADEPRRSK